MRRMPATLTRQITNPVPPPFDFVGPLVGVRPDAPKEKPLKSHGFEGFKN
jgi:hypothetical protein